MAAKSCSVYHAFFHLRGLNKLGFTLRLFTGQGGISVHVPVEFSDLTGVHLMAQLDGPQPSQHTNHHS